MSKVSRADFAPTTTWEGIIGKPSSFGVSDIGGLTGHGYSNGQVPAYNAATGRFRPSTLNPPSPTPTPTPTPGTGSEVWVMWDVPNLHALQTATEDFDFIGVLPSEPVSVGTPYSNQFVQVSATVTAANKVRVTVTNMDLPDLDLGEGTYRLRKFT